MRASGHLAQMHLKLGLGAIQEAPHVAQVGNFRRENGGVERARRDQLARTRLHPLAGIIIRRLGDEHASDVARRRHSITSFRHSLEYRVVGIDRRVRQALQPIGVEVYRLFAIDRRAIVA